MKGSVIQRRRFVAFCFVVVLCLAGCARADECSASPRGCTVFTVSRGDEVFFGGNDDWHNFDSSVYWVDPGSLASGKAGYGAIYFGEPDNVQQGFNEKGLAYDANGLPRTPIVAHPGRKPVSGGYASYSIHILRECATVEEVIEWVWAHEWHTYMHDQMHFADASGDAVVISAGPDGTVALTRKPPGEGHLLSTNYNLADPSNGFWPCWRYERAQELLTGIGGAEELTAERAASVLDAVHVASPSGFTVSSKVGDLTRGLVYVYLLYQFDAPVVLDVADEIARAAELGGAARQGSATEPIRLHDLFPPETVLRVERVYQRLMNRPARCNAVGWTWVGLVVLSTLVLVFLARPRGRALAFWAGVVVVLGPAGLLACRLAGRSFARQAAAEKRRTRALVEAVGDLLPSVVGMVAALLVIVSAPRVSQNPLSQLGVYYGLCLGLGFVFQALLLAWAGNRPDLRALWRRLLAALIATNLALAGLLALGTPLVSAHVNTCGVGAWTALSWWLIAVLGGGAGGLLLYGYHVWTTRRGCTAWTALLGGNGEEGGRRTAVVSPTGRGVWLWVLGSFVVLGGGIVLAVIVSMWLSG